MYAETTHEAALAAQREYMKAWRSRNKDKVRTYNKTYWQRVAERERAAAQEGRNDRDSQ